MSVPDSQPTRRQPSSRQVDDLHALTGLLAQVRDLKRVRDHRSPRSLAERGFARAWRRLMAGETVEAVALSETAAAVTAVRLASLDLSVMTDHGLGEDEAAGVLHRAFDDVAAPLDPALAVSLRETLGPLPDGAVLGGGEPAFVQALIDQPRAGATHPGLPRLVLEPAESHGDHCFAVAVNATLLAPTFGADPARVFLTGLAHHLFNTSFPDAGFAADTLIGDDLLRRMASASTDWALAQLPDALRSRVEDALAVTHEEEFDRPEARAFHAADVLDRVLEMAWHARAARFRLADALGRDRAAGQLDVCHEGFYQAFQEDVLGRAGLWPDGVPLHLSNGKVA